MCHTYLYFMSVKRKSVVRCVSATGDSRDAAAFKYFEKHGKERGDQSNKMQTCGQLENSRSKQCINLSCLSKNGVGDELNAMGKECSIKDSKSSNISKTIGKNKLDIKSS